MSCCARKSVREREGKREHLCERTLLKGRKHLGNWEDCVQSSVLYIGAHVLKGEGTAKEVHRSAQEAGKMKLSDGVY